MAYFLGSADRLPIVSGCRGCSMKWICTLIYSKLDFSGWFVSVILINRRLQATCINNAAFSFPKFGKSPWQTRFRKLMPIGLVNKLIKYRRQDSSILSFSMFNSVPSVITPPGLLPTGSLIMGKPNSLARILNIASICGTNR